MIFDRNACTSVGSLSVYTASVGFAYAHAHSSTCQHMASKPTLSMSGDAQLPGRASEVKMSKSPVLNCRKSLFSVKQVGLSLQLTLHACNDVVLQATSQELMANMTLASGR